MRQVLTDLKLAIDQIDSSFKNARDLILELARILDESGECERRSISRKIKEMLADKIQEGKITAKWIHDCLPSEYKREYKREVTSLSDIDIKRNGLDTDSQSDGSVIVQQIDGNAIHNNNKSLENDDKKAEKILIGTSGRSSNIESLSSDSSYGSNSVEDNEPKFTANKPNQNIVITTLDNQSHETDCPRCKELEDALIRASSVVSADKLQNEDNITYRIPKEKHDLLIEVVKNSRQFCSVIFDKNGTLVHAESDISREISND